jgi:hypothetical protein
MVGYYWDVTSAWSKELKDRAQSSHDIGPSQPPRMF